MSTAGEQIELMARLCNGEATASDHAALERVLLDDAAAQRQYLNYMTMHADLRGLHGGAVVVGASEIGETVDASDEGLPLRVSARRWIGPAAIAAMVMLAVGLGVIWFGRSHGTTSGSSAAVGRPVALLSDVSDDASWNATASPTVIGSDLTPGVLALQRGQAQVMYRRGAVVDLVGPCRYELTGPNRGRLDAGVIRSVVPARAAGFTVDAPGGVRVVDLGTEFEMRVDAPDAVWVKVLQGTVELAAGAGRGSRYLTAGRAVRLTAAGFEAMRIASVLTPGVESCSSTMRPVAAPSSVRYGDSRTAGQVWFFAERSGVILPEAPTRVSFTAPGAYTQITDADDSQTLSGGRRVDSYLLHFEPEPPATGMVACEGSITFARPIVGVMATTSQLAAGDARFGGVHTRYEGAGRGPRGIEDNDRITLSPDRRTLTLQWHASHYSDEVRVLVQADGAASPVHDASDSTGAR